MEEQNKNNTWGKWQDQKAEKFYYEHKNFQVMT